MTNNVYLVWLEWPEKCFRVNAASLAVLQSLVGGRGRVVRVRGEREFLRRLPEATHAIVWNFREEWFGLAPRLVLLATPAAGRELLPSSAPDRVKMHFGHFHGAIMAESVAAFVLAWAHGFFRPELRKPWPRVELSDKCREVAGTRAVVVGYGNVGRAIGAKLGALGVDVTGVTSHGVFRGGRRVRGAALEKSFAAADWLVMALPSTTGTDDYLDAAKLRLLPRRAVVINVGRGNSVDEKALYAALKSRRIAGAYLDVRKNEHTVTLPVFGSNAAELAALDNCITTPHSSAFSPRYLEYCFRELSVDGCL
ncbi:MAG: hypothetical protein J6T01_04930 [Kiritimatiellae bacterium]|nr:hypothetical protein [Kiritimatiellia bacterium]